MGKHAQPPARICPVTLAVSTNDHGERRILRLMVECRQAGYSLRDTAAELNRKGFTTRAGQPWRFEYVRGALHTLERQPTLLLTEL